MTRLLSFTLAASLSAFGQIPSTSPDSAALATSTEVAPVRDLKADANGTLSQDQIRELFRTVADKDLENDKKQRDTPTFSVRKSTTWMAKARSNQPRRELQKSS